MEADLFDLLTAAEEGTLTLETDEDHGQVRVMRSADRVLELRVSRQYGPIGWLNLRLYFTEPTREKAVILALSLEWKPDEPAGRPIQDAQIIEADRRIDDHYKS